MFVMRVGGLWGVEKLAAQIAESRKVYRADNDHHFNTSQLYSTVCVSTVAVMMQPVEKMPMYYTMRITPRIHGTLNVVCMLHSDMIGAIQLWKGLLTYGTKYAESLRVAMYMPTEARVQGPLSCDCNGGPP